jgi:hypothetical protein
MTPDDKCGNCTHLRKDHAKRGQKSEHPEFRSLSKAGRDKTNTNYYPTSEKAFCTHPICDCTDFIEDAYAAEVLEF